MYDAKDCNKVTQTVTGRFSFGGHLGFQNAATLNIFFWPISHLMSYLKRPNGGNTHVKNYNKITENATGRCFNSHLEFQNSRQF